TLEKHPYFFSPFVISLLRAGEKGGTMDRCLLSLADHLERAHQAKMDLMVKMAYPMLVVHSALVIPPIVVLFTKSLNDYLAVVLPGLFSLWGLMLGFFLLNRLGTSVLPLRLAVDNVVLHIPGVGRFVRASAALWFLRSLAELYEAGVGAVKSVGLAARACGNLAMAKRYESAQQAIDEGATLTQALTRRGMLPVMAAQTLSIAETSGTVGTSLRKAADMLDLELRAALNTMAVALPILIFIPIGIYVGYNLVQQVHAIYDPIFKM
ncbi:MAG: type II secretion system F family protein, partial [Candidatus Xenobia bacterium]